MEIKNCDSWLDYESYRLEWDKANSKPEWCAPCKKLTGEKCKPCLDAYFDWHDRYLVSEHYKRYTQNSPHYKEWRRKYEFGEIDIDNYIDYLLYLKRL